MAHGSPRDNESLKPSSKRLEAFRARLHATENDLRRQGYRIERCIAHPGSTFSSQSFDEEIVILLILGSIQTVVEQQPICLEAGGQIHVPAGVPFRLEILGESDAYWLQGFRKETPTSDASERDGPY